MSRGSVIVVLALVLAGGVTLGLAWRRSRLVQARAASAAAIRAVAGPAGSGAWVETFEAARRQPLGSHDPRWRPIFGSLLVDPLRGAVGDPEGGWERDGGDDYAFRSADGPRGSVEITLDFWWDGEGAVGAEGAVQPDPPHRLYEATLFRGRLALIYFQGPAPDQYEMLAESTEPPVAAGRYRLVFRMVRDSSAWRLDATLQDFSDGLRTVARISASDSRLGEGGQGIGILGGGASSWISGIAVKPL